MLVNNPIVIRWSDSSAPHSAEVTLTRSAECQPPGKTLPGPPY